MQTTGALGFEAEIEQKGDEKEFFLFYASPCFIETFCIWPDVNGVKKKALSA